MIAQADTTLLAIQKRVRRLTASPNTANLSDDDLNRAINTYYSLDFPSVCKVGQLRVNLEIFTQPNIDVYTIDINKYQGFGDPVLIEGYQTNLVKDQTTYWSRWPKVSTKLSLWTGDGTTTTFTATIGGAPFARQSVTIGAVNTSGGFMQISDDGQGNFIDASQGLSTTGASPIAQTAQSSGSTPGSFPSPKPIIGNINYVTGVVTITFPNPPAADAPITFWGYEYQPGMPLYILFWNNQITMRPIPDDIYRVTLEAYQTPVQFMQENQSPILNTYWQLIAAGAALIILQERQDIEGVQNVLAMYEQQKGEILNRNAIEQIGQKTSTIYNGQLSNNYLAANGTGWGQLW